MFDDIRCEKVLVKLPGLLDLAKKKGKLPLCQVCSSVNYVKNHCIFILKECLFVCELSFEPL